MDGLIQSGDAEFGFQRVRDAPRQNLAFVRVHYGEQIEEATSHLQVCDVGTPNLVRPVQAQAPQQIGVNLVPLRRFAGVGFLVDWRETHQAPDAFLVHEVVFIAQMPRHLVYAVKRRLQELLINHAHQFEVHLALALRLVVKRRPLDRQQHALLTNRQARQVRFNHLALHVPA